MAPVSRLQLGKFRATEKLGSIIKTIYHLDQRNRPRSRSRSLESGGRQGGGEIPFRFYEEEGKKKKEEEAAVNVLTAPTGQQTCGLVAQWTDALSLLHKTSL